MNQLTDEELESALQKYLESAKQFQRYEFATASKSYT